MAPKWHEVRRSGKLHSQIILDTAIVILCPLAHEAQCGRHEAGCALIRNNISEPSELRSGSRGKTQRRPPARFQASIGCAKIET